MSIHDPPEAKKEIRMETVGGRQPRHPQGVGSDQRDDSDRKQSKLACILQNTFAIL